MPTGVVDDPTDPPAPTSVYSGLGAEAVLGVPYAAAGAEDGDVSFLTCADMQPLTDIITGPLLQEIGGAAPQDPPVVYDGGSLAQLIEMLAEWCAVAQHPNPSQAPAPFSWLDPATNVQWDGDWLSEGNGYTGTIRGTAANTDLTLSLSLTFAQGLGVRLVVAVDGTVAASVRRVTDWDATPPATAREDGRLAVQGTFTVGVKSSNMHEGQFTLTNDLTGQAQYDDAGNWVTCQTDHNGTVLSGDWNASRLVAGWSGTIRSDYTPEGSGRWVTHALSGEIVQVGGDGVFLLDTYEGLTGYVQDDLAVSDGVTGRVRMDLVASGSGVSLAYSGYLNGAGGSQVASIGGTSNPADPLSLHWASGEVSLWGAS